MPKADVFFKHSRFRLHDDLCNFKHICTFVFVVSTGWFRRIEQDFLTEENRLKIRTKNRNTNLKYTFYCVGQIGSAIVFLFFFVF